VNEKAGWLRKIFLNKTQPSVGVSFQENRLSDRQWVCVVEPILSPVHANRQKMLLSGLGKPHSGCLAGKEPGFQAGTA
jgi:hypothetical protein